jgi:hypothetical protein
MFIASFGILIWISIIMLPFIITFVKKKKQYGKSWDLLSAKVVIQEKLLICPHCQNENFFKREALITTSWVTFFHLAFWNQSGTCFVCSKCGLMQWFSRPKEKAEFLLPK